MAKALVASRYNFFFPLETDDGSVLAYNSMKNSLLRLDAALYGRLEDVLAGRASVDASDEGVVGRLAALGFVVPEDFDELEAIRRDNFRNRTSARSLTLTIQPTLSCNFACAYCFQEHPRAFMGRDVEAALVRFVESHTPELERFGVSWFGGEPLLAINTIERLSRAFLDSAEAHGFEYVPAHLITNGWGLTAKNCRRLRECHLGSIQVTLDGIGAEHDRRRPLSDGSGTFDRIVDNLSTARTLLPDARLSIRVNIDAANPDALQHVREHLRAHGLGEVSVTIGHVQEYTAASRVERGTLNGQRLYQLATAADETALQRGGSLLSYPSIRAKTFCQAQKTHAYVVSPTGALFKCWIEAGLDESRAVGHLLRDEVRNRKDQKEFASLYEDWDQTQDAECAQCKVLPICGGGCLWKGMQARGDMKRAAKMCSPYKFGDTLERAVEAEVSSAPKPVRTCRGRGWRGTGGRSPERSMLIRATDPRATTPEHSTHPNKEGIVVRNDLATLSDAGLDGLEVVEPGTSWLREHRGSGMAATASGEGPENIIICTCGSLDDGGCREVVAA